MIPDNKDKKSLSQAMQSVTQVFAPNMDIAGARTFPDKTSVVPVKAQITAAATAQSVMKEIHLQNNLGHMIIPAIPAEFLAQAQAAYLNKLRREGGEPAVALEMQRRADYAELVRRNDDALDAQIIMEPVKPPTTPDMIAQSVVIYVDFEGDKGPKPTF